MLSDFDYFKGQGWKLKAKCQNSPFPDAWYGKSDSTSKARMLCQGCPVSSQCLAYALENDEQYGIWGGMTTPERRRLKRKMNKFVLRLQKQVPVQSRDDVAHPTAS